MKVVWSPEARQDLREIYLYQAAENPHAARALQHRINQGVTLLRNNPRIRRPGRVPGTREFVISGTSYIFQNNPRRPYRIRPPLLQVPAGQTVLGRFRRPQRQQSTRDRTFVSSEIFE